MGIQSPEKDTFNWSRTGRMALWGTAIGGPILGLWYRSLHAGAEALSVSYAPIVSGRLAWLAERTRVFEWVTALHKPEVVAISPLKVCTPPRACRMLAVRSPHARRTPT